MSSLITSKVSVREIYNSNLTSIPINSCVALSGVDFEKNIPLVKIADDPTDRIIGITFEEIPSNSYGEAITQGIVNLSNNITNLFTNITGVNVNDRIYWDVNLEEFTEIPNQFPVGYVTNLFPFSLYVDIVGSEISPGDDLRINDLYADEIFANNLRASGISNASKVIVLNDILAPTGTTFDQGGIILKADTGDKTILYDQSLDLWNLSNGVNVPSGSGFKINNIEYINTKTTDELAEGSTNRYYTEQYFDDSLATKNTDDLAEGSVNKYFTDTRAKESVISQEIRPGVIDFSPSEDTIYKYIKDSIASEEIIFHGEINVSGVGILNNVSVESFSYIRFLNAVVVTGFEAPTGVDENKVIFITNENTNDLILNHEDINSNISNRIITGDEKSITLKPKTALGLIYDRLTERWKPIGGTGSGSGLGSSFEFDQNNSFLKGQPIYYNKDSNEWELAIASGIDKVAKAVILEEGNPTFTSTLSGEIEFEPIEITSLIGSSGFIPGTTYYVSDSVAGTYTDLSPAISNPMLFAISSTRALVKPGFNALSNGTGESIIEQTFTSTLNQTTFTLDFEPLGKAYTWVSLDGIGEFSDFTISGKDIIFGTPLSAGIEVHVRYVKSFKLDTRNNIIPILPITATVGQTVVNLPVIPEASNYVMIWVNGARQYNSFSLVGNVLTFSSPLNGGEIIEGVIFNAINIDVGIDNFITRKPAQLTNTAETTTQAIFGENLSGEYRIKVVGTKTGGNMLFSTTEGLEGTLLGNSSGVYGTPNKLNIDFDSGTIRIQNLTGGTIQLSIVREL